MKTSQAAHDAPSQARPEAAAAGRLGRHRQGVDARSEHAQHGRQQRQRGQHARPTTMAPAMPIERRA